MHQQQQSYLQQPRSNTLDCDKIKKALIVVGKMGHGKSSFVNTLIRPKSGEQPNWIKKQLVKQNASLTNVTQSCAIKKVNSQHGLIPDLWVIDTPGLDSHFSPSLISQQIDNIIIAQKCDVIGIAYVININVRESGVADHSVLKQFLKFLKIKKQLKNKLIFFILSKWDALNCSQQTQTIQKLKLQFKKLIQQIGIKNAQDKLIQWVSYKQTKTKAYNFYIKQCNGQQQINNQWLKLKQILKTISSCPLKFQQHIRNTNNFWQKLRQRIFAEIKDKNITYNQNQTKIDYNLEILLRDWDIVQQQKNVMQVMMKIPFVNLIALLYSITTWYMKKQTKVVQTTNNNLAFSQLQFQKIQQKQLKKQIQAKLKSVIMLGIVQSIKLTKNKIVFDQIGKNIKIGKILIGYFSQFSQNLKVPVAFMYGKQINSKIEIDCFFENGNGKQQQVLLHQQKIVQMFRKKSYIPENVRIPNKIKIYVKQKQQKFNLIVKVFCKLPKQQCYISLIKSQCLEMFGKYN